MQNHYPPQNACIIFLDKLLLIILSFLILRVEK